MVALSAECLSKTYGHGQTLVRALTSVSLSIDKGKMVALLGPSGAGKSTLVKALGLVTPADDGRIWIDGDLVFENARVLGSLRDIRRKKLGFVFQRANLIPFLTARQNVEIACEIGDCPDPRGRAAELLEYLDVNHRAQHYPRTLSGGEQQRISIARALANRPALILADEPTAALDSVRGRRVMQLFRQAAHDHRAAVLVVTHDHRTLDLFDDLYEMEDGRLKRHQGAP